MSNPLSPGGCVVRRGDEHRGLYSVFAVGFFAVVIATAVAAEGHRGGVHTSWYKPLSPVKYHLPLSTIISFEQLSARPRPYTDLIIETSIYFY